MPSGIPTERVIEIQTALSKKGYYQGTPSGEWDDATTEALKQFQSANRLPATGLPSAFTLKKLGVSKTSNDGYSIPVKSVSQNDNKP
jgi:peptidoglycan hydrolase-like protein with peptidoglycan-binding domain